MAKVRVTIGWVYIRRGTQEFWTEGYFDNKKECQEYFEEWLYTQVSLDGEVPRADYELVEIVAER